MQKVIKFKRLHNLAELPSHQTTGSVGFDFISINKSFNIWPTERVIVATGLSVCLPPRVELQIRSRSGLAISRGIAVLNAPGTIDNDYRGEIKIILINLGKDHVTINPGDRIAQGVLAPYFKLDDFLVQNVTVLDQTERDDGGFGSTGR